MKNRESAVDHNWECLFYVKSTDKMFTLKWAIVR